MPDTKITDVKVLLPWEKAVALCPRFRSLAAWEFVGLWKAHKDREDSELRWGEEIEYMLVDLSATADGAVTACAALCADRALLALGAETGGSDPTAGAGWRAEYGNMMVEGVTHPPFAWSLEEVLKIEPALRWRRRHLQRVLAEVNPAVRVVTLTAFPLLGVAGCTAPVAAPSPKGHVSKSVLCPDEVTSPHPRFQTFTRNFRKRKGCKVGAFIPREGILPEQRLSQREIEELPFRLAEKDGRSQEEQQNPVPGYIYMDSQAFGASQCCTQATFLTRNLQDALYLTDQFLVLAPLFLALTAATPFLRGLVADTDTRWPTLQQTWDDRTREELGLKAQGSARGPPQGQHKSSPRIHKSRFSANSLFIAEEHQQGNDTKVTYSLEAMKALAEAGLSLGGDEAAASVGEQQTGAEGLKKHIAHVLVRDPMMILEQDECLDPDPKKARSGQSSDRWEQLQASNWNAVRFKPPPGNGDIGWRVEFRTPEVQVTDFENAAIVAVLRLLAEVIVEESWSLTIPISLCDENTEQSFLREAASGGWFWFRGDFLSSARPQTPVVGGGLGGGGGGEGREAGEGAGEGTAAAVNRAPRKCRLAEILSGEGGIFPRLRRLLEERCSAGSCSPEAQGQYHAYFALFEARAAGELPTPATFFRRRLQRHPSYRGDGVLPTAFVHDLCRWAAEVGETGEQLSELLGGS